MKKLIVLSALILSGALFQATPSHADTDEAEVMLRNATSVWLTLSVDDQPACSAPPGDQCVTLTSVGGHTLKASSGDRYITTVADVPAAGFTWTVYE